ncbi:MAG: CDC27 family protein [Sulfurovum sp.]|nr:CDC27 family protein [Sulfurovum sp.]
MHNVKALEEKWGKYYYKKKRPLYLLVLFFFILIITGMVLMDTNVMNQNKNILEILTANQNLAIPKKVHEVTKSLPKKMHEITKSLPKKMYEVAKSLPKLEVNNTQKIVDIPIDLETVTEDINTEISPQSKIKQPPIKKKFLIDMIEAKKNQNLLKEIAKRFQLGHNTDDSLFLAKVYYEKGEYEKAEYWAFQTNNVDPTIEESWLLFAKVKIKYGHKKEAIHILNVFFKKTHSPKAAQLLRKIQNRGF